MQMIGRQTLTQTPTDGSNRRTLRREAAEAAKRRRADSKFRSRRRLGIVFSKLINRREYGKNFLSH
jgi:hypothetical protein